MNLLEIKNFLKNKPGYLKEGGKRLRNILLKKGFQTTINTCKQAIKEVNNELKYSYLQENKKVKVLLYDIETSYGIARVWRPGYKLQVSYNDFIKHPAIICISYKWLDEEEVHTVQWDKFQDDKELLKLFILELNKADVIVAHNGDSFDLPWIKTRALYHNISMLPKYNSIDTLKIARYKYKFPSNRLDDLGDYLNLGRKIKTERDLWIDVVDKNNKLSLHKMTEYCEQDVILLEKIYKKLITQELPHVHNGVLNNLSKETSPYTGNSNLELVKITSTRVGTKKYLMKCLDTNQYFEMSNSTYKKYLEING